jgi:hypothetical protein
MFNRPGGKLKKLVLGEHMHLARTATCEQARGRMVDVIIYKVLVLAIVNTLILIEGGKHNGPHSSW